MSIKKAQTALDIQIKKLDSQRADNMWFTQTLSYIETFCGIDSIEYKEISKYKGMDNKAAEFYNPELQQLITHLLNVKESLVYKGIKIKRENILRRFSSTQIISAFIGWTGLIGSGGMFLGKYFSDVQNVALKQEVSDLKKKEKSSTPFDSAYNTTDSITHTKTTNSQK